MRKKILRIKNLFLNPKKEWILIQHESIDNKELIKQYFLPVLFLGTLSYFIGFVSVESGFSFLHGAFRAVGYFVASCFTIYFSTKAVERVNKYFGVTSSFHDILKFLIFATLPIFLLDIVANLKYSSNVFRILGLYFIFVVWEGVDIMFEIDVEKKAKLVLVISAIVFFTKMLFISLIMF